MAGAIGLLCLLLMLLNLDTYLTLCVTFCLHFMIIITFIGTLDNLAEILKGGVL